MRPGTDSGGWRPRGGGGEAETRPPVGSAARSRAPSSGAVSIVVPPKVRVPPIRVQTMGSADAMNVPRPFKSATGRRK